MSLLDNVKNRVNAMPAMEEYEVLASLEEDDDIVLEAMLSGEDSILGDSDLGEDEDDTDFTDPEIDGQLDDVDSEDEDPDLGEDTDNLDFTFESAMGGFDEEEDFDDVLDAETDDDASELIDQLIDTVNDEYDACDDNDECDEEDDD